MAQVFEMKSIHFSEPSILNKICGAQFNAQTDVKSFFRRQVKIQKMHFFDTFRE